MLKSLIMFLLVLFSAEAGEPSSICLNMIVKNEKEVIERCLTSVLPFIDYWVVVDTGSTDGTQEIVKAFMQKRGIPGELHERPWVDFGHNRNEALQLAKGKGDYVLFMDADDYLVCEEGFSLRALDKDYYCIPVFDCGTKYSRIHLVKNALRWKWEGVLHEVLCPQPSYTCGRLDHVYYRATVEGARSKDAEKYKKDAAILETALEKEPYNHRYLFYLAQSYKDAGDYVSALRNYEKRAAAGGWNQEVFCSLLCVASLKEQLHYPFQEIVEAYRRAYQYRPSRIEPLYHLSHLFRLKGDFSASYALAEAAEKLPVSPDELFVQQWMYTYGVPLERSISAYWLGNYKECQEISLSILKQKELHPAIRTCVEQNLQFADAKLAD